MVVARCIVSVFRFRPKYLGIKFIYIQCQSRVMHTLDFFYNSIRSVDFHSIPIFKYL